MNFKTTLRFGLFVAFCCLLNTHTWGMGEASTFEDTDASSASECKLSFTTQAVGVFCNEETGLIKIQITGGTAPFKIEWDNDDMSIWAETTINGRSFTIDYLLPGTYHIKIMDKYGCFLKKKQHISGQVNTLDLSISNNSSPCDTEGSIAVKVRKSSPPYYVVVDGPNGPKGNLYYENNFSINNLPEGHYNITVRKDECESTKSINVVNADAPLALQLSEVKTRTCDGNFGSIATNITGGHPPFRLYYDGPISNLQKENSGLTHSDGAKLVQNLTPGKYTFTVIDAEMCSVNQTITVNGPSVPAVTLETESSVDVCARTGNIWISASGGSENYVLSWQRDLYRAKRITTAGYSIDNVPFGTYVISIKDEYGCTDTKTIEVNTPIPDFQVSAVATRGKCDKNGSITVSYPSSGSFNVEWSGPSSGSAAGGAGSYQINDLQPGTYTVSAISEHGCVRSTKVNLGTPLGSTISFTAEGYDGLCGGPGSIAISNATATHLSWSGPVSGGLNTLGRDYTIQNLPVGRYTITVMDDHGCSSSSTVSINTGRAAMSFNTSARAGKCGTGGSIAVSGANGSGPYQLSWSGPVSNGLNALGRDYTIQNLPAGRYTITMTDANGCASSNVVNVSASSASDVTLTTESSINYCVQTGDIWVTPSGGSGRYTLTWSGGSSGSAIIGADGYSIAGVSPGHYTVTITDDYGCSATNSIEVSVTKAFLEYSIKGTSAVSGKGGGIWITFGNGRAPHTISWSGPSNGTVRTEGIGYDIIDLAPGDYEITVTDANGCFDVSWITIEDKNYGKGRSSAASNNTLAVAPNATLALGQNYPNPAEGTTTIPFTLAETAEVTIQFHNNFGKLVKQVQNTFDAGVNQYELNSKELGTGIIYYTLKTGTTTATKRMIIIK